MDNNVLQEIQSRIGYINSRLTEQQIIWRHNNFRFLDLTLCSTYEEGTLKPIEKNSTILLRVWTQSENNSENIKNIKLPSWDYDNVLSELEKIALHEKYNRNKDLINTADIINYDDLPF